MNNRKLINFFKKSPKKSDAPTAQKTVTFENCVVCGVLTNVPKDKPINQRENYVSGIGQLCRDCYLKSQK